MKKTTTTREHKILLEQIYQLRMVTGMTQQDLASKLKVPQSFISKVESGERRLDIIELKVICESLGSNLTEFIIELEKKLSDR